MLYNAQYFKIRYELPRTAPVIKDCSGSSADEFGHICLAKVANKVARAAEKPIFRDCERDAARITREVIRAAGRFAAIGTHQL